MNAGAVTTPNPRVAAVRTVQATPAVPATPAAPVPASIDTSRQAAALQTAALAKSMASSAPVDTDRVEEIKQALANGTFPILPATIADQMMAMRYDWVSRE